MKSLVRAGVALLLPAVLLAGCGGDNKKTAATVNGEKITEDEFNSRVAAVTLMDLVPPYQQAGVLVKAGEFSMQALINEKLLTQLAKEKNALPTDADINSTVPLAKKWQQNPQAAIVPPNPNRTEEEWRRDVRLTLIQRNLMAGPLKITEDEIKKEYDVVKAQLTPPDQYHLAVIDCSTEQKAKEALDALKNVPFETVALTRSDDPTTKPRQGDIGWQSSTTMPKELLDVVKTLKAGDFARKYLLIKRPTGTGGTLVPHYLIPKLVEVRMGTAPTLEEAKPQVIRQLIAQKDPSAASRVQEDLIKFRDKAKIEIAMKPYEHLLDKKPAPSGTPGGMPGAPAGAPGGPAGAPTPAPAATGTAPAPGG